MPDLWERWTLLPAQSIHVVPGAEDAQPVLLQWPESASTDPDQSTAPDLRLSGELRFSPAHPKDKLCLKTLVENALLPYDSATTAQECCQSPTTTTTPLSPALMEHICTKLRVGYFQPLFAVEMCGHLDAEPSSASEPASGASPSHLPLYTALKRLPFARWCLFGDDQLAAHANDYDHYLSMPPKSAMEPDLPSWRALSARIHSCLYAPQQRGVAIFVDHRPFSVQSALVCLNCLGENGTAIFRISPATGNVPVFTTGMIYSLHRYAFRRSHMIAVTQASSTVYYCALVGFHRYRPPLGKDWTDILARSNVSPALLDLPLPGADDEQSLRLPISDAIPDPVFCSWWQQCTQATSAE